jgi:endonuclease YncB( thermonuclease family)
MLLDYRLLVIWLLLVLILSLPLATAAEVLGGKVVQVVDGDTIYLLDGSKTQHKVRLSGIDAPERGQPFGRRSKERIAKLVAGKEVEVAWSRRTAGGG